MNLSVLLSSPYFSSHYRYFYFPLQTEATVQNYFLFLPQVECEVYPINLPVTFPSHSCCENIRWWRSRKHVSHKQFELDIPSKACFILITVIRLAYNLRLICIFQAVVWCIKYTFPSVVWELLRIIKSPRASAFWSQESWWGRVMLRNFRGGHLAHLVIVCFGCAGSEKTKGRGKLAL